MSPQSTPIPSSSLGHPHLRNTRMASFSYIWSTSLPMQMKNPSSSTHAPAASQCTTCCHSLPIIVPLLLRPLLQDHSLWKRKSQLLRMVSCWVCFSCTHSYSQQLRSIEHRILLTSTFQQVSFPFSQLLLHHLEHCLQSLMTPGHYCCHGTLLLKAKHMALSGDTL